MSYSIHSSMSQLSELPWLSSRQKRMVCSFHSVFISLCISNLRVWLGDKTLWYQLTLYSSSPLSKWCNHCHSLYMECKCIGVIVCHYTLTTLVTNLKHNPNSELLHYQKGTHMQTTHTPVVWLDKINVCSIIDCYRVGFNLQYGVQCWITRIFQTPWRPCGFQPLSPVVYYVWIDQRKKGYRYTHTHLHTPPRLSRSPQHWYFSTYNHPLRISISTPGPESSLPGVKRPSQDKYDDWFWKGVTLNLRCLVFHHSRFGVCVLFSRWTWNPNPG